MHLTKCISIQTCTWRIVNRKLAMQPALLPSVPISTDVSLSERSDIHIGEITYSKSMWITVPGIHVLPEDSDEYQCGYTTYHKCMPSLHASFLYCAILFREYPAPKGGAQREKEEPRDTGRARSMGGHSYSQVLRTTSVVWNLTLMPGMNPPLIRHYLIYIQIDVQGSPILKKQTNKKSSLCGFPSQLK